MDDPIFHHSNDGKLSKINISKVTRLQPILAVTLHIHQVNGAIVRADEKLHKEKNEKEQIPHDRNSFLCLLLVSIKIFVQIAHVFSANPMLASFLSSTLKKPDKINKTKTTDTIKEIGTNENAPFVGGWWSIQHELGQTLLNALKWLNAMLFRNRSLDALHWLLHRFATYIMMASSLLPADVVSNLR